ncbi:glycosyltransferase family 2 protein [Candidatus Falkowbacteria bacterium]|jgi:hypothetical protein|nr:glycosyltransferase family 2 protein [Candidatus Falkowbacteria bacterium]MBT4433145.1 glycosyltransferase family 2 protein [Candidatus Falkowbacteria bacterium]
MILNKLSKKQKHRILEIIPGALVWSTLIGLVLLAVFKTIWAIYFVIIFDVYWLTKILYMIIHMMFSWLKYRKHEKINWLEKLKQEKQEEWGSIYHLLVLPTFQEPYEVLRETFSNLIKINYPLEKLIVVLAGEERDEENFKNYAWKIKQEFGDKFLKLLITVHPKDIPGDLPGKGSNAHFAGKKAKEFIDEQNISYDQVIVSNFDVDTCPHREYFSYLTYIFLNHPNRLRASYQPIATYNNNIWDSPALIRVVHNSTTFWLFSDLARPERLFTFSSHSMSFKALVELGFWQRDIVTEDSRICLQGMVHYNGDYEVVPMFIPVSMNTAYQGNFWESMKNQYKQIRRWAYGVENFPYMMWNMWGNKKIKPFKKARYIWNQLEGTYSWATAPLVIFIMGWLPLYVANDGVKSTVLAQNAPIALRYLMNFAMIGLAFSAFLSVMTLPSRPKGKGSHRYLTMVLQWLLFPYCMIIFGSIPAIDAQTRLMLGKYLGFNVTKKSGTKS